MRQCKTTGYCSATVLNAPCCRGPCQCSCRCVQQRQTPCRSPRPRAGTTIARVHTEVRCWDVQCAAQGNRIPQLLPGCRFSLSLSAALLVRYRFSACATLALLAAACPRVLVAAVEPVQIAFSFIPSDTGCGHNKTHLIKETLRIAGRGNGSPHLVSARLGQQHTLAVGPSTVEPRWRRQLMRLGRANALQQPQRSRRSQRVNTAGVQTSSKQHRWEQRASPLSESWQTN